MTISPPRCELVGESPRCQFVGEFPFPPPRKKLPNRKVINLLDFGGAVGDAFPTLGHDGFVHRHAHVEKSQKILGGKLSNRSHFPWPKWGGGRIIDW